MPQASLHWLFPKLTMPVSKGCVSVENSLSDPTYCKCVADSVLVALLSFINASRKLTPSVTANARPAGASSQRRLRASSPVAYALRVLARGWHRGRGWHCTLTRGCILHP